MCNLYVEKVLVKSPNKLDFSWAVWGKIFKNYLWEKVRFDTNLAMGEDAVSFQDVLKKANKILYMSVMVYHYRQRSDSAMHTSSIKNILAESVQRYFLRRYYVEECDLC